MRFWLSRSVFLPGDCMMRISNIFTSWGVEIRPLQALPQLSPSRNMLVFVLRGFMRLKWPDIACVICHSAAQWYVSPFPAGLAELSRQLNKRGDLVTGYS